MITKVLILDDDPARHIALKKKYEGKMCVSVTTYDTFVMFFTDAGPWDIVSLDHDLGDTSIYLDGWGNPRSYTGFDAARHICESDTKPGKVVVHSCNPAGGEAMVAVLRRCGVEVTREPFSV